jgi:hypothetical protein
VIVHSQEENACIPVDEKVFLTVDHGMTPIPLGRVIYPGDVHTAPLVLTLSVATLNTCSNGQIRQPEA